MLDQIIGTKIDVSSFDSNYKNDFTGTSAIPPAALLKLNINGYYSVLLEKITKNFTKP